MDQNQFKGLNRLGGWLVLLISGIVYTLTMESTASLWDCGEFIASAYKQQVVHPPGAALFLMIGRMFTLLAGGNEMIVSLSMNFMSAMCSAIGMMFLFWTTTHIARRLLIGYGKELTKGQGFAVLGAGLVAALAGTFADSIWFSAVEGEVYSMSLMWSAMVFWSILQWDEVADEPYADRWLLFTTFLIGCSIFVHWLNLLTIPAMTFVYYFRRNKVVSTKGMLITFGIAIVLLGAILSGVITGLLDIVAWFELLFVNNMGLPFNSGLIFFLILLIGLIVGGLSYAKKQNSPILYNVLTGFIFILIGYSTITTTVIRSNAGPNIDMNSPRDIVSLSTYLKREQYGSRPFLTGHDFTAEFKGTNVTGKRYAKGKDKYDIVGERLEYTYKGDKRLFPRVYSQDGNHPQLYRQWLGLKPKEKPNFFDNISFFLNYQIKHMYIRYFLWNFAGRQNDEQGMGTIKNGNWISGIPFLDSIHIGNQSEITPEMANHPSRNTYFFLPLALGLLGFVFHAMNNRRWWVIVLLLFFFTGIAIIIQGNSPPVEPRERDYIFAFSFYAFCIWIGLGVVALFDIFKDRIAGTGASFAALGIGLLIPAIMGFQNWDDHDRSGRFAARDFAANYLNSCAPGSIIFTQGDNDTYPLWYAQEVEGIRRDVRVVNLSLLGVDWYINQLRRKVNDAAPVAMTMTPANIRGSKRDVVPVLEDPKYKDKFISLNQVMKFVADESPASKVGPNRDVDFIPSNKIKIPVDKNNFINAGAIAPEDYPLLQDEMRFEIPKSKRNLYKNDLMVLDIVNANLGKRPMYFAISVSPGSYLGLQKYFQLEGLAYRIVPITGKSKGIYEGRVNTDIMYENLINRFKFGNIDQNGVHVDSDLRRMIYNFRGNYQALADELIAKGDKKRAKEVLDHSLQYMPENAVPYSIFMISYVQSYYDVDDTKTANELAEKIATKLTDDLGYYQSLSPSKQRVFNREIETNQGLFGMLLQTVKRQKQTELQKKLEEMMR